MSSKAEAKLVQILEALNSPAYGKELRELQDKAITTCQQAQTQTVQEPSFSEGWERRTVVGFDALVEALDYAERKGLMPDYIADAWEGFNYLVDEKHTPPAAQRPWVGLTDEDKLTVRRMPWETLGDLMDNTEAKLKEKNHG
jgi:hypothetical protein